MRLIRYQTQPRYTPSHYPSLLNEMDRLFDAFFPSLNSPRGFSDETRGDFPLDLYQSKDNYTIRAELPGFRKEEIGVEVADGTLKVTGHHKVEKAADAKDQAAEAEECRFTRAITLPDDVDAEK